MPSVISESQLRSIVKVMLEDKTLGPKMVNVNPVVDKSAALTDPQNANFKPQSKPELMVALSAMINDAPDINIPDIYDSLKDAMTSKEDEEGKEQMDRSNKKVEETIRFHVRRMLKETTNLREYFEKDPETGELVWKGKGPAPALDKGLKNVKRGKEGESGISDEEKAKYQGPKSPAVKDLRKTLNNLDKKLKEPRSADAPAPGRGRKNVTSTSLGGRSFSDVASKLDISVSGVHAIVRDTLKKANFMKKMEDEDFEIFSLQTIKDYINLLYSTGELSQDDLQVLSNNPKIVADLDGYRDYIDGVIVGMMKSAIKSM